ncbi:MAG TPA: 3-oxoacid CoA-transferase subunit A, partial [Anaerolineaceae bacterium]|nr:3-oxoacid CoA-transferase subunit A [Anaerolineaceae bacterium]
FNPGGKYELLLKGGTVLDPANNVNARMDVAVADGKIAAVEKNIPAAEARTAVDVSGLHVSPGFLDIHLHCFYTDDPPGYRWIIADDICLPSCVTTCVDVGSSGAGTFEQFKKIIASHFGTNRETGRQMVEGETEVVLVPQGSLVEKIRAGGNGIGGFLVKTGLGTEIQKGKEVINVDGVDYLLKKPLRADVAILFANKADENGNLWYHGTTRNFNTVMATAADWVVVEAEEIVPVGAISPNEVVVPGVFIDNIVQGVK